MEGDENFDIQVPEVRVRLHLAHIVLWGCFVDIALLTLPCLERFDVAFI